MTFAALYFDGNTAGQQVTAANSGADTVTATTAANLLYEGTIIPHRGISVKCISGTNEQYFVEKLFTSASSASGSVYIRLPSTGRTASVFVLQFRSGTTQIARIAVTAGNVINLVDASNAATGSMTTAMPTNTWVRFDFSVTCNATTGSMTCAIFIGSNVDGTTPDETLTLTSQNTGTAVDRIRVGNQNTANAAGTYYFDDLRVNDGTTTLLGPSFIQVNKTRTLLWDVRAKVNKTRTLLWDVRAKVNKTNTYLWDTRAKVAQTRDIRWDVKAKVTQTRNIRWDVRAKVNKTNSYIWNVQSLAAATTQVNKSLSLLWDTRARVNISRSYLWDVRKKVGVPLQLYWNTLSATTQVNKTLTLNWDVRQLVRNSLVTYWNVEPRTLFWLPTDDTKTVWQPWSPDTGGAIAVGGTLQGTALPPVSAGDPTWRAIDDQQFKNLNTWRKPV